MGLGVRQTCVPIFLLPLWTHLTLGKFLNLSKFIQLDNGDNINYL
jgi:hypothetical protein